MAVSMARRLFVDAVLDTVHVFEDRGWLNRLVWMLGCLVSWLAVILFGLGFISLMYFRSAICGSGLFPRWD